MTLSTHVLDATTGRPAAGVQIRLERGDGGGWAPASQGQTDGDGRLRLAGYGGGAEFEPGVYRITFATGVALNEPRVTDACGLGFAIRTSNQARPPAW